MADMSEKGLSLTCILKVLSTTRGTFTSAKNHISQKQSHQLFLQFVQNNRQLKKCLVLAVSVRKFAKPAEPLYCFAIRITIARSPCPTKVSKPPIEMPLICAHLSFNDKKVRGSRYVPHYRKGPPKIKSEDSRLVSLFRKLNMGDVV